MANKESPIWNDKEHCWRSGVGKTRHELAEENKLDASPGIIGYGSKRIARGGYAYPGSLNRPEETPKISGTNDWSNFSRTRRHGERLGDY